MAELSRAQLEALYLPRADRFVRIDVPPLRYFMVDGVGSPHTSPNLEALAWLYAATYPVKRMAKERMGRHFVEAPLESLWWADDAQAFAPANRDRLRWTMMLFAPDWATEELFAEGIAAAAERLGKAPTSLRLAGHDEGPSIQIMHVGPNEQECATLERLHRDFLPSERLVPNGPHHEIYLNDPRRTAPRRRKTVLRQPVRSA